MNFRKLLAPLSLLWWGVTSTRNLLYKIGLFPVKSFKKTVIVIGNLSTGGTGKTPHTMYVLDLLRKNYRVAALSRGYGRRTSGFLVANYDSNARQIGDEPMMFFHRFKNRIVVSVGENRVEAIKELFQRFALDAIVLDDAFQHRALKAGFYILLTDYNELYSRDYVLPMGNLREPRSGANRANVIVVTKCPPDLSEEEKEKIKRELKLLPGQEIFFSHINYSDTLYNISFNADIRQASDCHALLITGIAKSDDLVQHAKSKFVSVKHLKYPDHYDFKPNDIKEIIGAYESLPSPKIMLTTEKDYMRLCQEHGIVKKLYYLPISIGIDQPNKFNEIINNYVQKNSRSN
ncbi:tetraacyldisaccharide 4'-kinase [Ornithobacterium rhinotracheale]|uniref:tetraacyldisaccharide 4'-kinase n=1 Tax=Ornithobacterium rhinotracheale TaxID=28251 RepID=UPI00129C9DF0|nr:tetraacyldisaccharide 4'-kinase [Ornithobacterium rhinotracheale]MRJ10956.1 tetraacyldisaccharide 4'-kinase [Ornithobacterium rhinotracheale]